MPYSYDRRTAGTKEDLNRSIQDVKKQISYQKRMIADLSDIASPLGHKAVDAYTKKERAHLANRENLLKELEAELKSL